MDSSNSSKRMTTSSPNSSSSSLQLLMYSTLSACILIFTFLAGHYDGERSAAIVLENRYLKGGNAALSKRLNEFKNGSGGTTAAAAAAAAGEKKKKKDNDVLQFTPRLIRKKKDGNNNNKKDKQKVWGRVIKVPDDWESWGFYDIHHGFKCAEHANDMNKPLPDMEFWTYYRNVYKNVVDKDVVQFNDPIPPTEGYTLTTTNGEEKQPYYAKRSPGKGRGLFASRDIKKGEVVHDGTNSDVIMSGKDFRRFLFALPQKMACDATEWSWTQQSEKDGPFTVRTAFNISILMNGSNKPNTMPKSSYSSTMYALRDIKKDEEILTDYKVYPTKYHKVGM